FQEEQKGKTVSRELKRIQEQSSSLTDSISAVRQDLQKHNMPFFRSYGSTQARARAQSSLSEPQPLSGALIDVAQHLGNLSFRVREKMKEKVQLSPVILDPNTTHVSSSLTIHRDSRYPTVLGSEGFSSGKHSWEVKVGDHPQWNIGFAKQSVDRKGELFASPKYGIWCLWLLHGKYTNGNSVTVTMKSLQRIRVQLDYRTHLYTHRDTFTEKLFPFFPIGPSGDATTEIKNLSEADIQKHNVLQRFNL
uniref:B30.2/SPRY domain-containing protein n=1 Tax=Scophthalmus maximus TaxID=52904 RepID=A0A8D3EDP8_SCOMX